MNDFYGFCSSMEEDIVGVAKAFCRKHDVGVESTLEVLVEGRIFDQPVIRTAKPERGGWKTEYLWLPQGWLLPDLETENYDDGTSHSWYPRLENRKVKPWTAVWSSKWADADGRHAAILGRWRNTYGEKLVT